MFHKNFVFRFFALVVILLITSQLFFNDLIFSKCYVFQESGLQKAKELFSNGEYEKAVIMLNKLIDSSLLKQKEQKIEAFKMLFHSYYNLGRKDEARKAVRNLLKIEPKHELNPTFVPPEKLKFFEQIKAELVHLTIYSIPSNLSVYIDKELQEGKKTPNRYTILDGKRHIFLASPDKTKYKPWENDILFEAGGKRTLNIELEKYSEPEKPIYKKIWF